MWRKNVSIDHICRLRQLVPASLRLDAKSRVEKCIGTGRTDKPLSWRWSLRRSRMSNAIKESESWYSMRYCELEASEDWTTWICFHSQRHFHLAVRSHHTLPRSWHRGTLSTARPARRFNRDPKMMKLWTTKIKHIVEVVVKAMVVFLRQEGSAENKKLAATSTSFYLHLLIRRQHLSCDQETTIDLGYKALGFWTEMIPASTGTGGPVQWIHPLIPYQIVQEIVHCKGFDYN